MIHAFLVFKQLPGVFESSTNTDGYSYRQQQDSYILVESLAYNPNSHLFELKDRKYCPCVTIEKKGHEGVPLIQRSPQMENTHLSNTQEACCLWYPASGSRDPAVIWSSAGLDA